MTLGGGILLCVLVCVLFVVALIATAVASGDSNGEAGVAAFFCALFGLLGVILITYWAITASGQAQSNSQVETGVVQEVVSSFTVEDHGSFALLRKWGSGEEAVYYRLVQPIPEGAKCVLFNSRTGVYQQDPAVAEPVATAVTCPVRQPQPAEKP